MANRWYHWPLSEEQIAKLKTPEGFLLRIKVIGVFFVLLSIYIYFYTKNFLVASVTFVGAALAIAVF